MEKLFENTTSYNSRVYGDFLKFHNEKYNLKYNLYTITILACIAFCIVLQFLNKQITMGILFVFVMVAFLSYRVYHPYLFIKKEANSNKIKKEMKNTYSFYNKYMEIKNSSSKVKLKYYKLYKFFETKEYFYLYINKNYSFILDKNNFSIGTPNEFSKFMKKKIWYK